MPPSPAWSARLLLSQGYKSPNGIGTAPKSKTARASLKPLSRSAVRRLRALGHSFDQARARLCTYLALGRVNLAHRTRSTNRVNDRFRTPLALARCARAATQTDRRSVQSKLCRAARPRHPRRRVICRSDRAVPYSAVEAPGRDRPRHTRRAWGVRGPAPERFYRRGKSSGSSSSATG